MKNHLPIFLFSSSFLLMANTSVFSQDLMQVYSDAASNSLRFKSASVDYQIAKEKKNEIMAEFDTDLTLKVTPSYTFSASGTSVSSSGRVTNNNADEVELDYSLGLKKPIYNKQLDYRISQADSMLEQENALLGLERQALLGRVAENYFNFLIAQNKLKFSLLEENAIRQNLNQLNILYQARRSTITDIKETESRLDQAISATASANNELDNARKNLGIMTGQTYYTLATLNTSRQFIRLQPAKLNDWLRLANTNSHEIMAANSEMNIQKKDISIQQADNKTTVDLFARYEGVSTVGGSSSKSFSDRDGKVGFEVSIPLYQGNKVSSRVRGANFKLKKAQYDLDLKKREVTQNVNLSYHTVMSDIDNIRALKRAVISSDTALRNIQRGRVAGTRTMTDVLSSLRESFQVKRAYDNVRYSYLLDIFKLKQAAGVLSVDDLRLVNNLLEASDHDPIIVNSENNTRKHAGIESGEILGSLEDAWGD